VRVLGVDPGLTRCGIGVVDQALGGKPTLVAVGVVRTEATASHEQRLLQIEQGITEWVLEFQPDAVAVERAFAQHNLMTVMGTIQAAGIAMLVGAKAGIPVALHTPTEVKAAITGSGRADKKQIGEMVLRILRLDKAPQPADAADAVALALTHLWRGGATNRYAQLVAQAQSQDAQLMRSRSAKEAG
jgi:crossover junction endodeoxyribonuclease RuvC